MAPLWAMPAAAVAALVRAREVSAREVAESALARMEAVNPAINAVVAATPEVALAAADAVDRALARAEDPGPLAGVPVTVKINVDMASQATTNGLRLQAKTIAAQDSPAVANLRRAGALILGQTNTPAFSIRWFTRNSLHGATRNPRDPGLTPGGSSGGAAAAVAAGIGAVAHGTDIAGSVRYPAYACGVHGLRPSLGRVPNAIPSGPPRTIGGQIMAVSGPMARRIADLELALTAMAVGDPRDPWWVGAPLAGPPAPRRVALSLAPDGMETAPQVRAALEAAARALEAAGWAVEPREPPSLAAAVRINIALWMAEFRANLTEKLAAEDDPDANLVAAELLARADPALDVGAALTLRVTEVAAWQAFLAEWPLLLCPVSAAPPFADHEDVSGAAAFARIFDAQLTQIGLPALGLPGLTVAWPGAGPGAGPMGVQLVAARFREDLLLAAGRAIEAAAPPVAPVNPRA